MLYFRISLLASISEGFPIYLSSFHSAIHWRFENSSYNVSEGESVLEVKVQANGTASFDYPISVTPRNLTATCELSAVSMNVCM